MKRKKNILYATTVEKASETKQISTSIKELTQVRKSLSVTIATSVLVIKDISMNTKEFTLERNRLNAIIVTNVSTEKVF